MESVIVRRLLMAWNVDICCRWCWHAALQMALSRRTDVFVDVTGASLWFVMGTVLIALPISIYDFASHPKLASRLQNASAASVAQHQQLPAATGSSVHRVAPLVKQHSAQSITVFRFYDRLLLYMLHRLMSDVMSLFPTAEYASILRLFCIMTQVSHLSWYHSANR